MAERVFDRETILDIAVNIIPLGMLLFFSALFLLFDPWDFHPLHVVLAQGQLIVPFVFLALITYFAARAIELPAR